MMIMNNSLTTLSTISTTMRNTLLNIDDYCNSLLININTMNKASKQLSSGTTNQASAIEEISSTLSDISTKISDNAHHSEQSNAKMNSVSVNASDSANNIKNLSDTMTAIANSSNEISNISRVIQNIASQTNLLSMNASVEAARAVEAGKGFAVVSEEIRSLALKCTEAANNTSELVAKISDLIQESLEALSSTTTSIQTVTTESKTTSEYIHNISIASNEQSEAIIQIANAIEQISGVTQTNSVTAIESARISDEMQELLSELDSLLRQYKY